MGNCAYVSLKGVPTDERDEGDIIIAQFNSCHLNFEYLRSEEEMAAMKRKAGTKKSKKSSSTRRRLFTAPKIAGSNILGKIGSAYVPPSKTTLASATGPFTEKKFTTFLYENALTKCAPAASLVTVGFVANNMYDFDNNAGAYWGNKQPLYYDALLSATGPYKSYKVISWKTTITVVNQTAVPINVWLAGALTGSAEVDSAAEADNFPGVKKMYLTASGGSKNEGKIVITGHIDDVFSGFEKDLNLLGAYNSGPGSPIYGSLVMQSADGTTNVDTYVAIKHEAYTELLQVDAVVS